MKTHWPQGSNQPFGIKNDFNWYELGAILRLVDEHQITQVIETGVGRGDLAAWMTAKVLFDPTFSYLGITNDPSLVDSRVIRRVETLSQQMFIAVGAPCADHMLVRVRRLVRNSTSALVLCNGQNIEREVDRYLPLLRTGDVIVANRFLETYNGRRLLDMARNSLIVRVTGDWMNHTRLIAGVLT